MTFTVQDYHEMVQLLRDRPELQVELRQLLLSGDLLTLPDIVRELAEAQRRTAEAQRRTEEQLARLTTQVNALAEAQQRTEEQLARLTARVDALAEAQQRTEEQLAQLTARVGDLTVHLEQLTARVDDLTVRLEQLTARVDDLTVRLEQLTARVDDLAVRMEQLAQAQQRTEEQLEELTADVQALTAEVRRLVEWQRGEAGRREGERYEQTIARGAPVLFSGGEGGTPDDSRVYQRIVQILNRLPNLFDLAEEQNPLLADLIWWKDGQFVVVEVSLVVDEHDVGRAARRAETLQQAGVQAMGMVIGRAWLDDEVRRQAEAEGVEWRVGDELSDGYLAFCRSG